MQYLFSYLWFTLLKARISLSILHPILVTIGLRGQIFHGVGWALGSCGAGRDEWDEEDKLNKVENQIFPSLSQNSPCSWWYWLVVCVELYNFLVSEYFIGLCSAAADCLLISNVKVTICVPLVYGAWGLIGCRDGWFMWYWYHFSVLPNYAEGWISENVLFDILIFLIVGFWATDLQNVCPCPL